MLSAKHRKFCEGIIVGMSASEAYRGAYPKAGKSGARVNASKLSGKPEIQSEVQRLRDLAAEKAGGAILTLMEKRIFLARVVRANLAKLDLVKDGDLLAEYGGESEDRLSLRIHDKLEAIRIDNDLAGDGARLRRMKRLRSGCGASNESSILIRTR